MEQKNMKALEIQDEDLEQVAGGGRAYDNLEEYKYAGIKHWRGTWFGTDNFEYAGKEISSDTASALVFYKRAVGLSGNTNDIAAALNYKNTHKKEYERDVKNSNRFD